MSEAPVPRVIDLTQRAVPTVRPGTRLDRLRPIFEQQDGPIAVVDGMGRPVGLVRKGDVIPMGEPLGGELDRGMAPLEDSPQLSRATAADVMVPALLRVQAEAPVSKAAALMAEEAVSYLLVVDATGRLRGLVTAHTLLRWLGRVAGYVLPDPY